jgi:hypothetical protein
MIDTLTQKMPLLRFRAHFTSILSNCGNLGSVQPATFLRTTKRHILIGQNSFRPWNIMHTGLCQQRDRSGENTKSERRIVWPFNRIIAFSRSHLQNATLDATPAALTYKDVNSSIPSPQVASECVHKFAIYECRVRNSRRCYHTCTLSPLDENS